MTRLVLTTIGTVEQGHQLARRLVDENLAACVSIIPNVSSVYKWKGQVEESSEVLLFCKTAADRLDTLQERIRILHPYELPEILVLQVAGGLPAYLDWVFEETRPG